MLLIELKKKHNKSKALHMIDIFNHLNAEETCPIVSLKK